MAKEFGGFSSTVSTRYERFVVAIVPFLALKSSGPLAGGAL